MAKNLEICYLLDFYGEVLTAKQRDVLEQYYNNDYSLSEIAENFGITRQGVRDAIKHGENTLLDLEEKVGFAKRYRVVEEKLAELTDILKDAKFAGKTGHVGYAINYDRTFDQMLAILASIEETVEDEG